MGRQAWYDLEYIIVTKNSKDVFSERILEYIMANKNLKDALINKRQFEWIEYCEDMEVMSKNFPELMLILEIRDEGFDWEEYFLNGRHCDIHNATR